MKFNNTVLNIILVGIVLYTIAYFSCNEGFAVKKHKKKHGKKHSKKAHKSYLTHLPKNIRASSLSLSGPLEQTRTVSELDGHDATISTNSNGLRVMNISNVGGDSVPTQFDHGSYGWQHETTGQTLAECQNNLGKLVASPECDKPGSGECLYNLLKSYTYNGTNCWLSTTIPKDTYHAAGSDTGYLVA